MKRIIPETARLQLREMEPSDIESLSSILQDSNTMYAIARDYCHVRQYAILFRKMLIKQTQKTKSSLLQKSFSLLTVFIFTVQSSVFKWKLNDNNCKEMKLTAVSDA